MTVGNPYKVTKIIKLHTNPERKEEIIKKGVFVRETSKTYIFDKFKVKKANVAGIEEIGIKWDAETIRVFAERLKEHYPHSPSIVRTIDKVAKEMSEEKQ